jgi:hypothetical protein
MVDEIRGTTSYSRAGIGADGEANDPLSHRGRYDESARPDDLRVVAGSPELKYQRLGENRQRRREEWAETERAARPGKIAKERARLEAKQRKVAAAEAAKEAQRQRDLANPPGRVRKFIRKLTPKIKDKRDDIVLSVKDGIFNPAGIGIISNRGRRGPRKWYRGFRRGRSYPDA